MSEPVTDPEYDEPFVNVLGIGSYAYTVLSDRRQAIKKPKFPFGFSAPTTTTEGK